MDNSDLVFYKNEQNQIISGGYVINSNLFNNRELGGNVMNTYIIENKTDELNDLELEQKGGKKYENYAVPAGLFFINQKVPKTYTNDEHWKNREAISDDMRDELLSLLSSSTYEGTQRDMLYSRINSITSLEQFNKAKANLLQNQGGIDTVVNPSQKDIKKHLQSLPE